MADAKRFNLDILCPNCGATGDAQVSEESQLAFHVDKYPEGISEISSSVLRQETKVRCDCDQESYLLCRARAENKISTQLSLRIFSVKWRSTPAR